jgi:hypothetical protein
MMITEGYTAARDYELFWPQWVPNALLLISEWRENMEKLRVFTLRCCSVGFMVVTAIKFFIWHIFPNACFMILHISLAILLLIANVACYLTCKSLDPKLFSLWIVTKYYINYSKSSWRSHRGDRVSVTAYVSYNRMKGYSRKYTIGYIASTCNEHRNTLWLYKGIYIGVIFYFKLFLTVKPSLCLIVLTNLQLCTARFCLLCSSTSHLSFTMFCFIKCTYIHIKCSDQNWAWR